MFHVRREPTIIAFPAVRMWTAEMLRHGEFRIVTVAIADQLHSLLKVIRIGNLTVHNCKGLYVCKCQPLTDREMIADKL